ncbi:MAG: hypothetical protein AAGU19_01050 [Prolixibacteraceae bacterium]
MDTDVNKVTDSEWEEIILRLTAFAHSWAKGKGWFRGTKTITFLEGKEAKDYALAAICKLLEEPDKYEPQKGSMLDYLKYNLVRSAIANDLRKKENVTTAEIRVKNEEQDDDDHFSYSDRIMLYTATQFPDDIDYATIKTYIESEIQEDKDAENILLGVYTLGMKRREIIEEFNMMPVSYDNGMRRLNTVLDRAAKFFTEKRTLL